MKTLFLAFISIFCLIAIAESQSLVRGPYLNMTSPTSTTIRWRTDALTNSVVHYGTDINNLNQTATLANYVNDHIITLNGLSPETKYYYNIGYSNIVLQGDSKNYFRTAPIANKDYDKPIRFWAVGDMSKGNSLQVDMINAFHQYTGSHFIDGFVMLGDNAYDNGYDIEYQMKFFDYYKDVIKSKTLWPVLGNHDYANNYSLRINHQLAYLDIFSLPENAELGGVASNTERYYSFNYGNIHFVMLDSYGLENVGGNYYAVYDTSFSLQYLWLKNDLMNNTMPWTIVCYHHPPYCMGNHNSDMEQDLINLRTNLNPLLEKYNVDLVLCGHCHTYQRSNMLKNHFGLEASFDSNIHIVQHTNGRYDGSPNSCMYIKNNETAKDSGVIYMVVGSGSAYPQAPFPQWPHDAMVYSNYLKNGSLYIQVEGNELQAKWISIDTAEYVKDQFTIIKNANKLKTIYTHMPDVVSLTASWRQWSTGDTNRTIQYFATVDTMIYVTDMYHCITDSFAIKANFIPTNLSEHQTLDFHIYPNPTQGELYITLPSTGIYEYQIFEENGHKVLSNFIDSKYKTFKLKLPKKLPNGTYFIQVINHEHKRGIQKFILNGA
ncbi:MAG TPA: metallophosphoesterase [Chitinophagaceae bacterium]|nr:metallophosphoesterase [Chitinophagaceae bacterium]